MAFQAIETKTVVGFDNKIDAALITAVTIANATAHAYYPVTNLKYDDPWRMCKVTTSPTAAPQIKFQFAAAQMFTCFGIINHNLATQSYGVTLESSVDNSTWVTIGSITAGTMISDGNILLRFPLSSNHAWWRITLTKASAWPTFYVGSFFLGQHQSLITEPLDGGVNSRMEVPIEFTQSSGQAKHVRWGVSKYTTDCEMTFERASQSTVLQLAETVGRRNLRKTIAFVQPGQVSSIQPVMGEHLFAYLQALTVSPRVGAPHKADIVLQLAGVL